MKKNGKESIKEKIGKYIIIPVLAVIMTAGTVFLGITYQNYMVSQQNDQLMSIAENASNFIDIYIEEYEKDMDGLIALDAFRAADSDYSDGNPESMKRLLSSYISGRAGMLSTVYLEGTDKPALAGMPVSPMLYGHRMGIHNDRYLISIVQYDNNKMYIELKTYTPTNNLLVYLLDAELLYQQTLSHINMGEDGYVMVKDSTGTIIMHSLKSQIGIDVIADRQQEHPDYDLSELKMLIENQQKGLAQVERYHSYWWGEDDSKPVEKISAYLPLHIGQDFLIISAVINYDDIAVPIKKGAVYLVAVSILLLGIFILVSGGFLYTSYKQKKTEEENIYLKEVNNRLNELRSQEEALAHQQRLQLIGTLTGGIAHEFSNLLTPIMGYSAMMLQNMELTDENYSDIEEIYESSLKAKEIIDQISSFSGKNSHQTFRKLEVAEVLSKAVKMIESVKPKNVKVEVKGAECSLSIMGNMTQLHQVILNLCTNSFHAMKQNDSGLLIIESMTDASGQWLITIRDNGIGMSKEILDQIFNPFFTTKKPGEGVGLGLAIVQRIIENHGGHLSASSVEGEGTCFTISLPAIL